MRIEAVLAKIAPLFRRLRERRSSTAWRARITGDPDGCEPANLRDDQVSSAGALA